jgi:hypothetical protein
LEDLLPVAQLPQASEGNQVTSILPHNIVNDTRWKAIGGDEWVCFPSKHGKVALWKVMGGKHYGLNASLVGTVTFAADSLPAAKADALRLVREAILAEAEARK